MKRVSVHLDLWISGGYERFFEFVLGVRLRLIVAHRDTEIHFRFDLRREQMWAIGLVGDQTAAVERSAGAYAIGQRGSGPHH